VGRETHDQARGAGRHRLVACFAPGNLDEVRSIDTDEAAANEDAIDVHREQAPVRASSRTHGD
jgi:hypothetical protein